MNYKQLFAELDDGAVKMRNAIGEAFLAIDSNPRLALLAEMATQIKVTPDYTLQKGDLYELVEWNSIYSGDYLVRISLPREYKQLVWTYIRELGFSQIEADPNHLGILNERFRNGSPVEVCFYRKVKPGDHYGKCEIVEGTYTLKSLSLACPVKEEAA